MWKAKLVRDELVYSVKEISKQSVEGAACLFLATSSQTWERSIEGMFF